MGLCVIRFIAHNCCPVDCCPFPDRKLVKVQMNKKGAAFDPFSDPFMDLTPLQPTSSAPTQSAFDVFDMLTPTPTMSGDAVFAIALYDYSAQMENQIGFRQGDRIKMLNVGESGGWSEGETLSGNDNYCRPYYSNLYQEKVDTFQVIMWK
jgi:hypothetical protein